MHTKQNEFSSNVKSHGALMFFLIFYFIPYFFSYKTEFFSFQNNPKDLDPSYKMDLDVLNCFGRVKLVL